MATLNEVSAKITEVDAKQDKEIAVLSHKVEDLQKTIDDLTNRIRKNERWIAGAGAVITAAVTVIGLATALESKELPITTEVTSYAKTN
jgi:predicted  nucleic acid-binding Zn-ribbon protein